MLQKLSEFSEQLESVEVTQQKFCGVFAYICMYIMISHVM